MQLNRSFFVSRMSFFCGWVASQINDFFIGSYLRLKRFFLNPRMMRDALKAVLIRTFAVCSVLSIGGLSKIKNSIIRWISVDVIYLAYRPFLMNVKPCKSMCHIAFGVYFYVHMVLGFLCVPCFFPNKNSRSLFVPVKKSSFRFVTEYFSKIFMLKFHVQTLTNFAG